MKHLRLTFAMLAITSVAVFAAVATQADGGDAAARGNTEHTDSDTQPSDTDSPLVAPVKRMRPQMPANAAASPSNGEAPDGNARKPTKNKQRP